MNGHSLIYAFTSGLKENGDSFMAQFLKDEVREKIKKGAITVFTDKGYQSASIKEIAAEAQVSVGNVYRYFDHKEALYNAVLEGVNQGVVDILELVKSNHIYRHVLTDADFTPMIYEPMGQFYALYTSERKVFDMLLKNGVDVHYEETIGKIIELLKSYLYSFWGQEHFQNGLSMTEVSALTNAIVFAVVDLLSDDDDDVKEKEMMGFVSRIIRGYFMAKNLEVAET